MADNTAIGADDDVGLGGGVGLEGTSAPATFTNTTFSDNGADGLGGGIFTRRSMMLQNVSIIDNVAPPPSPDQNGAGFYQQFAPGSGSVTTARNVLLALNVNGGCGGTADPLTLDSNNGLLDELDRVPGPSCNADPGDNTLVNAGTAGVVATLEDNGGLTETHELPDNSPAIGEGVTAPPTTSVASRGGPDHCDIGAYEFGADNLTPDVSIFTDERPSPAAPSTTAPCASGSRRRTATT